MVTSMNAFCQDITTQARMSLPFLPDLHTEVRRAWVKPYSARINFSQVNYADVEGMQKYGYALKPPIEEMLASYLSVVEVSALKTPSLPTKLLRVTLST